MKRDFVPQRTCVSCRKKQDKAKLLRIARIGGEYYIDIDEKTDGRGVYICKTPECAAALKKKKGLNRAFRSVVPEAIYDGVVQAVEKISEDKND